MKVNSLILFAFILFMACNSQTKTKPKELSGVIKIDGSSTVFPITESITKEFRKLQPNVKINVGISGTGGGFRKFSRGESDISDASRSIKPREIELCKENNLQYIDLKIAYDGLAIIVNHHNNWVNDITLEELKMIWEPGAQGKIMKWSQIRPEWPDEEIHLFGPGIASGTYDFFTEAVIGKSGYSRGDFTASEDDNVLVEGIAGDRLGLGFFGLAFFEENQDKLKLVPVNTGNGPISPDSETVSNGTYALSRPLFLYINDKSAARDEIQEYIKFYLKHASKTSGNVGYVPLPQIEYTQQSEKFDSFIKTL